tara:strand:- start:89 stop:481 length:393 start_codon:yes stop_codon:yes gene_type:complete
MTSITEDELQKQVAAWLNVVLPDGSIFHHSPNEGRRHVNFKMKLKLMGTQPGWPDLEILCPETLPIFIELKRPKPKSNLSLNQLLIRDQILNLGCHWALCRSLDEVHDFLRPIVALKTNERNFSFGSCRN